MLRFGWHRAVAITLVFGVLVACSDASTTSPSVRSAGVPDFAARVPGCDAAALYALADQLSPTPARGKRYELRGQLNRVLGQVKNNPERARQLARSLATTVMSREVVRLFKAPTSPAQTREQGVQALVAALFGCVGLDAPDFSQLPSNWSGLLYGGIALIGPEGGDLVTTDSGAGIRVPAGAVSQTHLFAIIPRWTASTVGQPPCFLQTIPYEIVGQCYDLVVEPYTTFELPVRLVICAEPAVEGKHDYLQVAKQHNEDPVVYYPKLSDPFPLDCHGETVLPKALYEQIRIGIIDGGVASAAAALRSLASLAVSPFLPATLYAADGVGSDIQEFSSAALVYIPPFTEGPIQ